MTEILRVGEPVPCSPTNCDESATLQNYPPPPVGGGEPPCLDGCDLNPDGPPPNSPIIMALGQSSAYRLTGAENGVWFDINADGSSERVGWPAAGEPLGFLALDRNRNGVIDSGRELFGNYTPIEGDQTGANGFEALAHWDRPEAGGNGDGWIDNQDAVWGELLVWIDGNHDGFTQLGELFHPSIFQVKAISLDYREEGRRDQFGNFYRLKAQFVIGQTQRWAYDVFFATKE